MLSLATLAFAIAPLLAAATPPLFTRFERQTPDGALSAPLGIAVAPDGTIVVADSGRHRIVFLDRTGAAVRAVGSRGSGPGEFLFPSGVAIAPSGDVVVADTGNHRVQVLFPSGASKSVIGGPGGGPGRFHLPSGVAASADRIAVADTGNSRVQLLAPDGAPIASSDERLFARPVAVAIAPDGRVFAADADLHAIVALDAALDESARFGGLGFHRGLLAEPSSLALHAGALYVADTRNHRVQLFDLLGSPLGSWGEHAFEPREGSGKLHYPDAVAISPDGSFAVIGESIEDRLQLFAPPRPALVDTPPPATAAPGSITHFGKPIAAAAGLVALVDPERDGIVVYDARGREPIQVTTFGVAGFGPGRMTRASGLALSPDGGRLAIADGGRRLLQEFALDREPDAPLRFDPRMSRFVKALDGLAPAAARSGERPMDPAAVARDGAGRYHVLDARGGRVLVFDPRFERVGEYGGGLEAGCALALDPAGGVAYVALPLEGRVRAIDTTSGAHAGDLGRFGDGDGEFACPAGIAVASDGTVSVSDSLRHRVLEFDAKGRFLRALGGPGVGAGEFWKPAGLARDERSRLLVVDHGNHRVQIFSAAVGGLEARFEGAFGARTYVRHTRPARERD